MVVYRSLGSLAEDRALAVLYRPLALTAVLYPPSHNPGRLTIGRRCQEGGEVLSCEEGLVHIYFPLSVNFTCFGKWALKAELFCVGTG